MVETVVFVIAGAIVLAGAAGVITSSNPVYAALSLVASLFGIAVLFVAQEAHLLAAVQVIVYTGAIVVLILFVLMLLGVDKAEDITVEPIAHQRLIAVGAGALGLLAVSAVLLVPMIGDDAIPDQTASGEACERDATFDERVLTGQESVTGELRTPVPEDPTAPVDDDVDPDECGPTVTDRIESDANVRLLGRAIFTDYVFAFEVTALLLTIAVVGAVVMARRVHDVQPLPPEPEPEPEPEPAVEPDESAVAADADEPTDEEVPA